MSDPANEDKIKCELDGAMVHSIQIHLKRNHPSISIEDYRASYPGAPILSAKAEGVVRANKRVAMEADKKNLAGIDMRPMADVFDLGKSPAALNTKGQPVMSPYFAEVDEEHRYLVPDIDSNYIFDPELVKSLLIANHMKANVYVWGYHGTGKTTLLEQVAARQGKPQMRVQHTINMEEGHVTGGYEVKGGETKFNLGPLPLAMLHGWDYLADEYDRGSPQVLSLYQAVLEGKPLLIKEAPPEFRRIVPHAHFRFQATGNTNGAGDETGLYQGASMQDAANFSRFGVTLMIDYMEAKRERAVVASQATINDKDAEKLVEFAGAVRENFKASRISATISPRELINAAKFGACKAGAWREGLGTAWMNRLSRTDKEVCDAFAQRIFG